MSKVVKKFGGTSLENEARINLAAKEVIQSLEAGDEVIVVVSAMGSEGDPYSTNTLIDLLKDVSHEVDSRKKDLMMSCGETISASLFSHYLDSEGYSAVPMTGHKAGIFTDDNFGNADIIDIDPVRINHYLSQGKPVVLAGFQGRTVEGEITTLGRGGSDTTAIAIANQLGADYVELFTDVPGVAAADPKVVENPKYFSELSRIALERLTENGSEVVHSSAVEKARESGIPIRIKCAWDQENETLVRGESGDDTLPIGITSSGRFTMVKGESSELNRDSRLRKRARELIHLESRNSLALVPQQADGVPRNGYERNEDISVVTVVGTGDQSLSTIRSRVIASAGENYLERVSTDYGLKFLVDEDQEAPLVRGIHETFYSQ
ncbi:aspartate kinase [Candidatus Bipolaricaulota bacterium]|nr:aspartate kinase [Candidatus Bipolaricaulota bacterium]